MLGFTKTMVLALRTAHRPLLQNEKYTETDDTMCKVPGWGEELVQAEQARARPG